MNAGDGKFPGALVGKTRRTVAPKSFAGAAGAPVEFGALLAIPAATPFPFTIRRRSDLATVSSS
jgi:hypothetical protein